MQVAVCQYDGATTLRALPLAAGLLVASARRDPALADSCRFSIRTTRRELADEARALAAHDVVGLSLYTWNVRYSLASAAHAKATRPDLLVVVGGPSVPRRPADAQAFADAHPQVDVLVFGEGEVTFPSLLRALSDGRPLADVPGVAVRDTAGALVFAAPRPRLVADPARYRDRDAHPHRFADTASPYLDGTFDTLLADGFAPQGAIFETNRGCPFACSFCDWGQATASEVHELPITRVEAELEWAARHHIPYVYLVDANFGMRKRDLGIIEHMGRLKARHGAPGFCYFHLTKNARVANLKTVLALQAAGIRTQVALSVQDFDPAVLAAVRRDNIDPADALALRAELHRCGIPTMNELLLGLPQQTLAGFRNSVIQALTPFSGDSFMLYPTRLLINAPLAEPADRERYGLETRVIEALPPTGAPQEVVETEEIVVATHAMPVEDWRRAFAFGFLTSALHNHRVLARTLQVMGHVLGLDREAWLVALTEQAISAAPTTALGAIGHELLSRADAVLAGQALIRPVDGAGPRRRDATEAVTALILARPDAFFTEVAEVTAEFCSPPSRPSQTEHAELLAELLRWERLWLPSWQGADATAHFGWDWYGFFTAVAGPVAETAPPQRVALEVRAPQPSWAAAATFPDFVDWFIASAWAKEERLDLAEHVVRDVTAPGP